MSVRFQAFAYNSRTVWSSYMKCWQQFEIIDLHVCNKFLGNWSRDFDFRTRKPPQKFGVKSGLIQNGKKYFIWFYVRQKIKTAKNISYGFKYGKKYFIWFYVCYER